MGEAQENMTEEPSWYIEWAWVGGYSSASTLVLIFNLLIIFSVAKNKFLHYSFHYVVVALSLRNILQVCLTISLVILTKIMQTPWLFRTVFPPPPSNSSLLLVQEAPSWQYSLTCDVLSTADHILSSSLMFYLAALSLYMFCRSPNPGVSHPDNNNYKLYGVVPVKERAWITPLLLLLPPILAVLLSLPVPLLSMTHPMVALPGDVICKSQEVEEFSTYESSVAILGFLLPISIVLFLLVGFSIRRCISCSGGTCVSSFCKEELSLALLSLPYALLYLLRYLPLIEHYLGRLDLGKTGLQQHVGEEVPRALEMMLALLLPLVVYSCLPPYRQFTSEPDMSDVRRNKRLNYNQPETPTLEVTKVSQSSLDMEMATRINHYEP